jgi:glucose/arabinose dehydrogenase
MKKIFILLIIFLISIYALSSTAINSNKFEVVKKLIPEEIKLKIKKVFFKHKILEREVEILSQQNENLQVDNQNLLRDKIILKNEINLLNDFIKENLEGELKSKLDQYDNQKNLRVDFYIKKNLQTLSYYKKNQKKLTNKLTLINYDNPLTFQSGINKGTPGSAFIDFADNNLFLISAIGITAFGKIEDDFIKLKQIKNNIDVFIGEKQFLKSYGLGGQAIKFSIKDIKIINKNIYVSYTNELKENCWNTSIIVAKLNYDELNFKQLFSPNQCVINEIGKDFTPNQSGGRIVSFDDENILLTIGEFRQRDLAQQDDSVFGKILKINLKNNTYENLSKGHRNPQGLFYDKINNIIISTEHGPKGGDEINIIKFKNLENIANYGWPISSYGEHYAGERDNPKFKELYDKYPLLKSHSKYDFVEPIKYFNPSIGPSEIVAINKNKSYVAGSMKDQSLYFFELDDENKIKDIERVNVGERIRDLIIVKNKLILFLEDNARVGIINL